MAFSKELLILYIPEIYVLATVNKNTARDHPENPPLSITTSFPVQ